MSRVSPQYQIGDPNAEARAGVHLPAGVRGAGMPPKDQVPLLLKPNGVPVFHPVGQADAHLEETLHRGLEKPPRTTSAQNDLERTVRAHNFVVGKAIQNSTSIAVFEVTKNSEAQEQNFPVRVIYVKPGISKNPTLRAKAAGRKNPGDPGPRHKSSSAIDSQNRQENDLENEVNRQMDPEVSMGEISGIFKQQKQTKAKPKRPQSESQKHAQQRAQAQRAYAEQVRQQAKVKEQQRQVHQRAQASSADCAASKQEKAADNEEAQFPKDAGRPKIPHSSNRFEGQYSSMTKDLFRKAQAQIKEEKEQERIAQEERRAKQEKEQQYLEDIKERNQELVMRQKERGATGVSLKEREERLRAEGRREELEEERERKKFLRAKRAQEDRAQLGLDQLDRNKLKEFQDKKHRDQLEQEAARRQEREANEEKALKRRKDLPRKGVIDFTNADLHDSAVMGPVEAQADEVAQLIVDKKQILKDQRVKRRQQELERQKEEQRLKAKKEGRIKELEDRVKQQRDELARKQILSQERQEKWAGQQREANKAAAKRPQSKKDRSEQLSELRDWINDQMNLDELKIFRDPTAPGSPQSEQVPAAGGQMSIDPASESYQEKQGPNLVKHQLPGNSMIPMGNERKLEARQNRYGLQGVNEFDQIVQQQRVKDGLPPRSTKSASGRESAPEGHRRDSSPQKSDKKSDDSYDYQPVRGERRVIINQGAQDTDSLERLPGVMSVQKEAARQDAEKIKRTNATVVIQKWARGWQARRRGALHRGGMGRAARAKRAAFADHPDLGEPIDFHKFLYDKPKQHHPLRPDDDDISEKIGDSGSHGDVQTQSYIPSQVLGESGAVDNRRSAAMLQNFFGPSKTPAELDPLSIISIFAKQNTVGPSPQQVIPEKDRPTVSSKPERRTRASFDPRDSRRSSHKAGRAARHSPQKPMKRNIVEEDIEEDIVQTSKDLSGSVKLVAGQAIEERYSSDFVSEHITESIASYRGLPAQQAKADKQQDSSLIEESIHESLAAPSKGRAAQRKAPPIVVQASATQDSIQEDEHLMRSASIASASIEDEVQESKEADMISEESILNRQSDLQQSGSAKRPKVQQKAARIRHNIEQDYRNDGFESYSQSLKAQKLRQQDELAEQKRAEDYRMSGQIIKDFEERKAASSLEHQRAVKDLTEELKRYEAAVSGSVFFERFQNTVSKSLAQKDVMMLGQRLSQLEGEAKHKQEIADIRTEQARMLSQLMLLTAGSGSAGPGSDAKIKRQQEQIMQNIQSLIEKPIIIQRDGIEQSQQASLYQLNNIQESAGSKKSRKSGQQQRFSSIEQSLNRAGHVERAEKYSGHEDIEEDVIGSEIQESMEDSIKESIDQSQLQQSQNEQQQLSNARRMLGSEQAVIEKSKSVLEQRPKRPSSPFEKNSFQDYTSMKFKSLLFNEGTMMDDFLDQIEVAVARKQDKEKKQLQTQLQTGRISPKTFHRKARDLEKWVSGEKKEISQKRRKVQDTCAEIGSFLNKLDKDKQLMLDGLNSSSNTPRGLKRSASQVSASQDSETFHVLKEQLQEIRTGQIGGERPETKYLNKKREFVRQLMKEKKDAIDRGVREKMRHLEGDMIDEMIRTALSLDVDQEVDRRIEKARQMLELGQIDESASKSVSVGRVRPTKSNKKNVKFQSPSQMEKYSSSAYSQHQESSVSKGSRQKHLDGSIGEGDEDMIGESIKMDESYQPSSSASKVAHSAHLRESAGKVSRSTKKSERIEEQDQEDEDSLDRDEAGEQSYSNDFVSESIHSASLSQPEKSQLQSAKALQSKAADIEESGYSERFEDASMGQSQSKQMRKQLNDLANARQNNDIEIVNEEDDNVEGSSNVQSNNEMSRPSESQRESARERGSPASEARDPAGEYQDKEILESTSSVEWQITLQKRTNQAAAEEPSAPGPSARDEKEESDEREAASSDIEEDEVQADDLEDLESCPSGSLTESKPNEEDFRLKVDEITAHLLESILSDFRGDGEVKMEVEDDVDEEEFEDKWPYSLDKRQEEPEEPASAASTQLPPQEEAKSENQQDNEAKKRHDQQMQKFHEEQKQIEEHHKKVLEYLDFIVEIVDKEVLQQALEKPIEHDPLKILEKIQALDTEDEIELTSMAYSQQQSALPAVLFDEIEKRLEGAHQSKEEDQGEHSQDGEEGKEQNNVSRVAQTAHHLAIFDAFNEALDQERPYKFKGLPNPWSKQTRVTHETLSAQQVDQIIGRARARVIEWDKTGAGTKFAPAPPPPPLQSEYDPPHLQQAQQESEDERNKAERQERLGLLLTKEVHQREQDWLDYEIEDTQARFDLADMILEELAGEVAQFLEDRFESNAD